MKRPSSMRLLVTAMAETVILGALVGVAIASDSTWEPKAATAPTVVSPADNAISSVASGEALVDGLSSERATEVMTKEEIAVQSRQFDGRIPAGEHLGPIVFDAIADNAGMTGTDPGDYTPFPWLAQKDQATYMQLRAAGESFTLVQGDDRYFHLVR